jgi:hypothetical protein
MRTTHNLPSCRPKRARFRATNEPTAHRFANRALKLLRRKGCVAGKIFQRAEWLRHTKRRQFLRVACRHEPAVQHAPLWHNLSIRSWHRHVDSCWDELGKLVECKRGVMRNDGLRPIVMTTA